MAALRCAAGLGAACVMRSKPLVAVASARQRMLRLCVFAAPKGSTTRPVTISASITASELSTVEPDGGTSKAAGAPHAEDQFFATELHTFASLGLSQEVCAAVSAAKFKRPSRVQELAVPAILSGSNVVLAAETGSGKSLAYLLPLAQAALHRRATSDGTRRTAACALVLCPNNTLCQQLVAVANRLRDTSGQPLLRSAHLSSTSPPPFDLPELLVCTPGYLTNLWRDQGASYGMLWTPEVLGRVVRQVVVDEADILLSRAYAAAVDWVLESFKAIERRIIEDKVMQELGIDPETFSRLRREVKVACWRGGAPGMLAAGYRPPKDPTTSTTSTISTTSNDDSTTSSSSFGSFGAQPQQGEGDKEEEGAALSTSSSSSDVAGQPQSQQQQQQYGPYFKRQWVFVAATMPSLTKGDVGTELQQRFKDAVWITGDLLHKSKPKVDHTWVSTPDEAAWQEGLLGAIQGDPAHQAGAARVMVFTASPNRADEVGALLSSHGVAHVVYHKNLQVENKDTLLQQAFQQPGNVVAVTTDAVARGLDLPAITHVIQADFAATATDFLHRIGRTGRAGQGGRVTSLYRPANQVLAETLQQYIAEGRPVEDCFSRNRSFSKKLKRFGTFVPRGQGAEQAAGGGSAAAAAGGRQGGGAAAAQAARVAAAELIRRAAKQVDGKAASSSSSSGSSGGFSDSSRGSSSSSTGSDSSSGSSGARVKKSVGWGSE